MRQPEHLEDGATNRRDLLPVHRSNHRFRNFYHVADGIDRQHDLVPRHRDPNGLGDQQAGRKLDTEAGSFSNLALNMYGAVQRLDTVAHDIHANAPP